MRAILVIVLASCAGPAVSPAPVVRVEGVAAEVRVEGAAAESEGLRPRVQEAFSFALRENGWSQPDQISASPLEIVITDLPRGTLASASGPLRFSITAEALHAANVNGLFAHELTHVQAHRVVGRALASIPRYLEEGKALAVGRAFRAVRNEPADDAARADLLAGLSARDGREALDVFRDGAGMKIARERRLVGRFMSVGVFFIEFLRTRGGTPDVLSRLSRVWERVGSGAPVERAFNEVFRQPLADLEAEFVTFLRRTENDPVERLRGTAYARANPR